MSISPWLKTSWPVRAPSLTGAALTGAAPTGAAPTGAAPTGAPALQYLRHGCTQTSMPVRLLQLLDTQG